ncbi:MAG: hypothetical protein CME01_03980 [Geminicoccus sp.]|nr:hypothetical protein [Geminicoccus sp.]
MKLSINHAAKQSKAALRASVSGFGLWAGMAAWSNSAQATDLASNSSIILPPDHYRLADGNSAVVSLETGQQVTLNSDQYIIFEDGVLLIVDDAAQAAMIELPVIGLTRVELGSNHAVPLRLMEGQLVVNHDLKPIWTGDGPAPRLFEQIDIQRYEIAQVTEDDDSSNLGPVAAAGGASMGLAGLAMMTSWGTGQPVEAAPVEAAPTSPDPATPGSVEFVTNAQIPHIDDVNFTGSSGESFIGITPLLGVGKGSGNTATFDMRAGGDNLFFASTAKAPGGGEFHYIAGDGDDTLAFRAKLAYFSGEATFDMTAGGRNVLFAGEQVANSSGSFSYEGGAGTDIIALGNESLQTATTVAVDMSEGGTNLLRGSSYLSYSSPFNYTGGPGRDMVIADEYVGSYSTADFDMQAGGNNLLIMDDYIAYSGVVSYTGGSGTDNIVGKYDIGGALVVDLSQGGDNLFVAGTAQERIDFKAGPDADTFVLLEEMELTGSELEFDNTAGGRNIAVVGSDVGGTLDYNGGAGSDLVSLGAATAKGADAVLEIDLGDDSAKDIVLLEGKVDAGSDNRHTLSNFDFADGDLLVIPSVTNATVTTTSGGVVLKAGVTGGSSAYTRLFIEGASTSDFNLSQALVPAVGLIVNGSSISDLGDVWVDELHSSLTSIVGTSGDTIVGLSPLDGYGSGVAATIDLSAGGDNLVNLKDSAGQGEALTITGGSGNDDILVNDSAAQAGLIKFDMSLGGSNLTRIGAYAANTSGTLAYTGGAGSDVIGAGVGFLADSGSGTFDMSLGGDNVLSLGEETAGSSGELNYTGGTGSDVIVASSHLAKSSGKATFTMTAGGDNVLSVGDGGAISSGQIAYYGGSGSDLLTFDVDLAESGGLVTMDMSLGGENTVIMGESPGRSGQINYTAGSGTDTVIVGDNGAYSGTLIVDASQGGQNTFIGGQNLAFSATFTYTGGTGRDALGFGRGVGNSSTVLVDLGADSTADYVFFEDGDIGSGGTLTIQNFDQSDGDEVVIAGITTGNVSYTQAGSDVDVSSTGGAGTVTITISDTTVSAITSGHYNSSTGLVIA